VNLYLPRIADGRSPATVVVLREGIADHDVDVLVLWICFKVLLSFFFVAASDGRCADSARAV
jgi:hypothetical protein